MIEETTRIELPPPRMIRPGRGSRFPKWAMVLCVLLALGLGLGGGVYFGLRHQAKKDQASANAENSEFAKKTQAEIKRRLAEARIAVGKGDWLRARELFQGIQKLDPDNVEAEASLPLINKHLAAATGTLLVETRPPGASVKVKGFETRPSPAQFTDIPLGHHELEISLKGYQSLSRDVNVNREGEVKVPVIQLSKITGKLEVVSEPKGVEFKLLKADKKNELKELVEVGKTPALIEKLDPGEYKVLMAVKGWPEYSELIRVEENRNVSVSAVFARGGLNVTSNPVGAEVWVRKGKEGPLHKMGTTPLTLPDLPIGKHQIELRHGEWAPISRTVKVADGVTQNLEFSWEPSVVQLKSDPSGAEVYLNNRRLGKGNQVTPFSVELPAGEYIFTAKHRILGSTNVAVNLSADKKSNPAMFAFDYGAVKIESEPSGAAVVSNGVPLGRTPLQLPVVRPGNHTYQLSLKDYATTTVSGSLQAGASLDFNSKLKYDPAPSSNKHFKNGFGQSLVWFGSLGGWVDSKEVTQEIYEKVMGGAAQNPSAYKAPSHPVDSVTWYKAVQFCEKLTILEAGLGNIPAGYHYRLPTDAEWSQYVGKQDLNQAVTSVYQRLNSSRPVATMEPNEYGLFDVRGNVWEWCNDWYSRRIANRIRKEGASANQQWIGTERKVLRGGAWNRFSMYDLSIANRRGARPSTESDDIGFRVVLMKK